MVHTRASAASSAAMSRITDVEHIHIANDDDDTTSIEEVFSGSEFRPGGNFHILAKREIIKALEAVHQYAALTPGRFAAAKKVFDATMDHMWLIQTNFRFRCTVLVKLDEIMGDYREHFMGYWRLFHPYLHAVCPNTVRFADAGEIMGATTGEYRVRIGDYDRVKLVYRERNINYELTGIIRVVYCSAVDARKHRRRLIRKIKPDGSINKQSLYSRKGMRKLVKV